MTWTGELPEPLDAAVISMRQRRGKRPKPKGRAMATKPNARSKAWIAGAVRLAAATGKRT